MLLITASSVDEATSFREEAAFVVAASPRIRSGATPKIWPSG